MRLSSLLAWSTPFRKVSRSYFLSLPWSSRVQVAGDALFLYQQPCTVDFIWHFMEEEAEG